MDWIELTKLEHIEKMNINSFNNISMCFKHSTRCSISVMVLNRIENEWNDCKFEPYFLDLLNYRNISNTISETYKVIHESPQVLLIKNGVCIHHISHNLISMNQINQFLN